MGYNGDADAPDPAGSSPMFDAGVLTFQEFLMREPLPLATIQNAVLEFLRGRDDVVVFGAQAVNAYVGEPRMTQEGSHSLLTLLGPAPPPARRADARTEEGLSSAATDSPGLPRPRGRRVLAGGPSPGFPVSLACAAPVPARLPRAPLPGCGTPPPTARDRADCRGARPPQEGPPSRGNTGDIAPPLHRFGRAEEGTGKRPAHRAGG
jgi:hypothetical protein